MANSGTTLSRRARHPLLVLAVAALLLGGCSEFEALYPDATAPGGGEDVDDTGAADAVEDTVDPPEDAGPDDVDAPPEDVGPDVPPPDVGEDVDEPDADAVDDVAPEVDADAGPDPDGDVPPEDTGLDADVPPDAGCTDACSEEGVNRCDPSGAPALERCEVDPDTGCLRWEPHTTCEGGDVCDGPWVCADGECAVDSSQAVVCPPSDEPCAPLACDPADGVCKPDPIPVNGECDDGDPCTVLSKCQADGSCGGGLPSAVDCPCDGLEDCLPYDDGDLCNGFHDCVGGTCISTGDEPTQCEAPADSCLVAVCDPSDGQCKQVAGPDDEPCDDGDACTSGDTCSSGTCVSTDEVACDEGLCAVGVCDPATGTCDYDELVPDCCGNGDPEGDEQCDDGDLDSGNGCEPTCLLSPCDTLALTLAPGGCVRIPGDTFAAEMTDVTVELFIRPQATEQDAYILDREVTATAGDADWSLRLTGPAGLHQLVWNEGREGLPDLSSTGPILTDGAWQHVALTRDQHDGTITWWLDGVPTGFDIFGDMQDLGADVDTWLGCQDGVSGYLDADIDELRVKEGIVYTSVTTPPALPFFVDEDTLALYHFDHTQPGVAVDAGPHGANGYWKGLATLTADDAFAGVDEAAASCGTAACGRSALLFDPLAEGVGLVSPASALDDHQELTIELFVRVDDAVVGGEHVVIARDSGVQGAADWRVSLTGTQLGGASVRWTEGQQGGFDNPIAAATQLDEGVWYHVAVVRRWGDGGDDASIQWFIDGSAEPPKNLSGALELAPVVNLLSFGSQNGQSAFLDGAIDEVRITAGALYDGEFLAPTGLAARHDTLAMYHFDEGLGDTSYPAQPSELGAVLLQGVDWTDDPPFVPGCPP